MRWLSWLVASGALLVACRGGNLTNLGTGLGFSSPDQPSAVTQTDSTNVTIDFGAVGLGATKSLTLRLIGENGTVGLGTFTTVLPDGGPNDAEFSLPLVSGTSVGAAGVQVVAAFAPTALGSRVADYALATDAIGAALIHIQLTGEGVPQALLVAPDPIAFGNVELNQPATLPVTITNTGANPATLSLSALSQVSGAAPALFSLDPPSSSALAVGASITFNAHFTPTAIGPASAAFELSSCAGCGVMAIGLTGSGVTSVLQAAPDPLHFGFVIPGVSAVRSFTLTNTGTQTFHLLAPGPALAPSAGPAGFALAPPVATTPGSYPFALAPAQSAVIPIAFVPPRLGFFSTNLTFPTDDPGASQLTVPIDGYGGGAQISCAPSSLGFGAVQAGQSAQLPIVCTNVGVDVPNHPEAGLLVTAAGLTTDLPPFKAALAGTAGLSDAGVLLVAGENVEVDVTYAPGAVESDTGTLKIVSNDTNTPTLAVPLAGQGVQPGACNLQVTPAKVAFGEVPVGGSADRQVEIANASAAYCAMTDLALDPASDAAFQLPGGPIPSVLLGYPGNPAGAATAVRVTVVFAPQASEALATGALNFGAEGTPMPPLPLTGSSAAACLQITPPSDDFGRVGFDVASGKACVGRTAAFTAQNVCDHPVQVTALTIDSGLDAVPQFSLIDAPQLPQSLVPAAQLTFGASFAPTAAGPKVGTLAITTDEANVGSYEVSVLGDAEASGARTDTFTAQQKKVDLVFVLDNDDDLVEISAVAQELPGFLQAANDAQLDYRIAVTTTDLCNLDPSDQGSFEPCSHCTAAGASDPTYFTPETPNAAQALSDLFLLHGPTACLITQFGDEYFFGALAAIFEPSLIASHNAGFLRDDAYLALAIVNGDGEDDRGALNPASITALVQSLKPDPSRVSVSYIDDGITALAQAPRVQTVVLATGGVLIDTSTRWEPNFFNLFWANQRLGGFSLSTNPDPATLLVEENGVPFAAQANGATIWSYDPVKNSVVFTPQNLPVPGTEISVGYTISCE